MRYNKTNRDWCYRSLLEIVSPQLGKYCPPPSASGNISSTSGKQFPIVTSTPVTICIILATKNSESLPENIAGNARWRPQCGWMWHMQVCLAADWRSRVHLFEQWVAAKCTALSTANAGQPAALWPSPCNVLWQQLTTTDCESTVVLDLQQRQALPSYVRPNAQNRSDTFPRNLPIDGANYLDMSKCHQQVGNKLLQRNLGNDTSNTTDFCQHQLVTICSGLPTGKSPTWYRLAMGKLM